MKYKSLFLLLLFFYVHCSLFHKEPGAPQQLRCEYRTNPSGINAEKPRLFWLVNDQRRGAKQTAYQIQVASEKEKLQRNEPDIWDTGKEDSDNSSQVMYDGALMESDHRYYWRVRTWDHLGKMSRFSEISWWETALYYPNDWEETKWIGQLEKRAKPDSLIMDSWIWHPTNHKVQAPIYFRHDFDTQNKPIQSAILRITADNTFHCWLNGQDIGEGNTWSKMFLFNVTSTVVNGKNQWAVEAVNLAGDICGLIACLEIKYMDGDKQLVMTNKKWQSTDIKIADWISSDPGARGWLPAREIEPWGGPIWEKPGHPVTPPRSTLLRKEFAIERSFTQANVYVTGLGSYVLYVNGQRVGDDVLAPGWTAYGKRIFYQAYDISKLLKKGNNAVAAVLGNAWWSGGLGSGSRRTYSEGPLRLRCKIKITFPDDRTQILASDNSWQTHDSPILFNNLYDGEIYDSRLEQPGWNEPDFNAVDWPPAVELPPDSAILCGQEGPPIRITEELKPKSINEPLPNVFVFDMGQNMVGCARLRVKEPAGQKIQLRFSEVLNDNGTLYTDNLRGAKATDAYYAKGAGTETWQPLFTYHGFRYVEVTGLTAKPDLQTITGCVFHNDAAETGQFSCSNELLNRIQHNISWGLRGNMHSVPTDCPQRDERLGWMGDAQAFAPTACFNRDMADFFNKWLIDISDCQTSDGAVYDINPTFAQRGAAAPGWGDAVVIVPWVVYQYYGDRRILEQNYKTMAGWVQYMKNHSRDDLYEREGYGDWVAVTPSPSKPIGAAYYYRSVSLMSQIAKILGKENDVIQYAELAQKIAAAFHKQYYQPALGWYEGRTQAANLLPLAFGITPKEEIARVAKNIADDVRKRDTHLSTGFLATPVILQMLSRNGYHDLAYQVAAQKTYPSWGHMVEKGATTIWELWNSDTEGPSMNSRNHFALGSHGRWYYDYLAGLRVDVQQPGYKRSIIAPRPVGDLQWVEAKLNTLYGVLACRWEKGPNNLKMWVTVPANTTAEIHIPLSGQNEVNILEGGQHLVHRSQAAAAIPGLKFVRLTRDAAVVEAAAGNYEFLRVD